MKCGLILIRGGGDLASAVAWKLYRCGFSVAILEIKQPLVVRRTVSYAQAVVEGEALVEGVKAVLVKTPGEIIPTISRGDIPVLIDPQSRVIDYLKPYAVIDSTMAKKNRDMDIQMAPLTLALGPGFTAKEDVDAVIETKRGHSLGRIIYQGQAIPNTGIPDSVNGYGEERVLRAPCQGRVVHKREIGEIVKKGTTICLVDNEIVKAPFDGMLRGLIMQGARVKKGLKIGDVDPRCQKNYCYSFSDKARAVAGGVLEAVLYSLNHKTQ